MATHIPVTARALVQRLNRVLPRGVKIKKSGRGFAVKKTVGEWYMIRNNRVVRTHLNLEAHARKLGVIAAYERLL